MISSDTSSTPANLYSVPDLPPVDPEDSEFRKAVVNAQSKIIPEGLLIVSPQGEVLFSNQPFADLWQIPAALIAAKDYKAILGHIQKQVFDPENFVTAIEKMFSREIEDFFNKELRLDNGQTLEWIGKSVTGDDGRYFGWAWYFRDKTGRMKSDQQLKLLSDFIPQILWATDAQGYHDFYNKRWYEFTGLSFEETKNTGWSAVLHPDDYERTLAIWTHCLQTGDLYETEYRMKRADGEYRWLLARAMPLRNEEGEIVRWFGTCTDIHDQKLASDVLEMRVAERTREIQEANRHLQSINRELQQFNYIASHDLQEPLRKIMIFAERIQLAENERMSRDSREFLEKMVDAAERMSNLLKDLLEFSSTKREEHVSEVDLQKTISSIESDLEVVIAQKSATIRTGKMPVILAIPHQMHQLFYNLVSNALKFTSPDRPPVVNVHSTLLTASTASEWKLPAGIPYYHIQVEDNGIGFRQEFAERIFDLFKRLHNQQTYKGTGVGLALCKKVVENHHGLIWAESEPDQRTVFHLVLPVGR